MNIILTGMPGCGKSTIGVVLAKNMGYKFIDSDIIIQNEEERLLQEILDKDGTERFLEIEEKVLSSLRYDNTVIATGGSAVYSEKAINHLKENGKVVYIRVKYENIKNRLANLSSRGVVGIKEKSIEQLFEERIPLYEKYADITVDCDESDIALNMEKIKNALKF